jgi:hypothetical protein
MDKKTYKRLSRALRGARRGWMNRMDDGLTIYPMPVLPVVCGKIARRQGVNFDALIKVNLWLNGSVEFDRA